MELSFKQSWGKFSSLSSHQLKEACEKAQSSFSEVQGVTFLFCMSKLQHVGNFVAPLNVCKSSLGHSLNKGPVESVGLGSNVSSANDKLWSYTSYLTSLSFYFSI